MANVANPNRAILTSAIVLAGTSLNVLAVQEASKSEVDEDNTELLTSVREYFTSEDPARRRDLADSIEKLADGSVERVKTALGEAQIWKPVDGSRNLLDIPTGDGTSMRFVVSTPADYDPSQAYPLLIVLSELDGDPAFEHPDWLRELREDFVIAGSADFQGFGFDAPRNRADIPQKSIRVLRKKFHTDSRRTYLYGKGRDGDAALNIAVMHPYLFAAVGIQDGIMDVPYRQSMQTLLGRNLRCTPVRLAWNYPQLPPDAAIDERGLQVALANQSFVQWAKTEVPTIQSTVLPNVSVSKFDGFGDLFSGTIERCGYEFEHWFRYPLQGRAGFLRISQTSEEPWEGSQLQIVANSPANELEYQSRVLKSKLFHVAGRIEGQTIKVRSSRSEVIDILLTGRELDFANPVHIEHNGKRRFTGMVEPRINTMLESAYEEWEFQNPASIRLRLGPRGRVRPF